MLCHDERNTGKQDDAAMLGRASRPRRARRGDRARQRIAARRLQHADGHWVFELEADATIPAEYILLQHYLGRIEPELRARIARYIRATQGDGRRLAAVPRRRPRHQRSVKAYFALKAAGDPVDAPHMARARAAILARGGARRCNVFTRILLALFGEVPWRAVPVMPVEIMLLPRWFPFHIAKVSYWSRTVLVPLLVLMALRPRARNPRGVTIARAVRRAAGGGARLDLPVRPPRRCRLAFAHARPAAARGRAVLPGGSAAAGDRQGGRLRRPSGSTARTGSAASSRRWPTPLMMFDCLGYAPDHPELRDRRWRRCASCWCSTASASYCQPCVSPVWDTALACHALMEVGDDRLAADDPAGARLAREQQVLDMVGDWAAAGPGLRPGGWAFQYRQPALPRSRRHGGRRRWRSTASTRRAIAAAIDRAAEWVVGMQSRNGGWGSFDADNTHYYLNHIPFADHGALLDPPTADVSARCLGFLAQLGYGRRASGAWRAALDYLRARAGARRQLVRPLGHQLHLRHLVGAGRAQRRRHRRRMRPRCAAPSTGCVARQHADGGWGEGGESYWPDGAARRGAVQHRLADRLGAARPDGGRRGRPSGGRARHRLSDRQPGQRRQLGRAVVHRGRLPARLLPALPRLPRVFPALGAGPLPPAVARQLAAGDVRHCERPSAASRSSASRVLLSAGQSSRRGCGRSWPFGGWLDYGCAGMGQHLLPRLCQPTRARNVRAGAGVSRHADRD